MPRGILNWGARWLNLVECLTAGEFFTSFLDNCSRTVSTSLLKLHRVYIS